MAFPATLGTYYFTKNLHFVELTYKGRALTMTYQIFVLVIRTDMYSFISGLFQLFRKIVLCQFFKVYHFSTKILKAGGGWDIALWKRMHYILLQSRPCISPFISIVCHKFYVVDCARLMFFYIKELWDKDNAFWFFKMKF